MHEIDKSMFSAVTPLLQGVSTYLSLPAITTGRSSGRIWVDDPSTPSIACVWDLVNGFLFVLKDPTNSNSPGITSFLKEELLPLARTSSYTEMCVLFFGFTNPGLEELVKGFSFSTENIYHFHLTSKDTINEFSTVIPPNFYLKKIDSKTLFNNEIKNMKEIKRCITACWRNLEDYSNQGIGYILLTDNTVVSWCSTDYVVSTKCDLYVETFNDYKRKGFGTLVTLACTRECLNQKYEVNWHCWHDNKSSIKLAEKIGFSRKGIQKVYILAL
jgi:RimJ/RimL family protein N-acetyltransferase